MKSVDLYHLTALVALVIVGLLITFRVNYSVTLAVSIGVIAILLLGVHLILDKQGRQIECMNRTLTQIEMELIDIRTALDFEFSIKPAEQAAFIDSLGNINRMINEMKQEGREISLDEIKTAIDDLKMKVEEISVKTAE